MSALVRSALALAVLTSFAAAQDAINWSKDLATAFAEAKEQNKVLMICVNAKYVDGKKTEERANKGLREVVYKNARVVKRSREFVCVLFTPAAKASEYGELRLLGIEGWIVSPQHIFVHPDGEKILLRKEYWSHGSGDVAVNQLIIMMNKALANYATADKEAKEGAGKPAAGDAPTGEGRAAWIAERIQEVSTGNRTTTEQAIGLLIKADQDGDCTTPLLALLDEHKKNPERLAAIVRGLGRDTLLIAAPPVAALLTHKDKAVRGNAAVTLEYIGSNDKKVVSALLRAAGREKDVAIANHMYRAVGRCGVGDSKVRSTLVKKCGSSKSEFASYGPTIALAYFEGDKKAARGVEKVLKKVGVPGSRRGGGQNTVKRGVLCWTLASIGDKKSGDFVREELIAKIENVKAFWVGGLRSFYKTVARVCDGKKSDLASVEEGVRGFVAFARGGEMGRFGAETRNLMDEYRKDRDNDVFKPKGDFLLGRGE